jgi:transposase
MTRLLSVCTKQSTMLKNKLHGEAVLGQPSKLVVTSLKRSLRQLKKEIDTIEEKLFLLVNEVHKDVLTGLKSIPGIGKKTSLMLVVLTGGSSVNGRARIRKIGNQKLRNLLFMCSFNACKYNKACKAIYYRIVAKGKRKKLALIAVCNKLLKQAFAIAKSGLIYDETYRSTLVKN